MNTFAGQQNGFQQGFAPQGFQQAPQAQQEFPKFTIVTNNHFLNAKVQYENGERQARTLHIYGVEENVDAYPVEVFATGRMSTQSRLYANQPRYEILFVGRPSQDPSQNGKYEWSRLTHTADVLTPEQGRELARQLVQQDPNVKLRITFRLPKGSKFQTITCKDAATGADKSLYLYSELPETPNDNGYLGYYLKNNAPIRVVAGRKQPKQGNPFWALEFYSDATDAEIFQQGGTQTAVYGNGAFTPTRTTESNAEEIQGALGQIQQSADFNQGFQTAAVNPMNFAQGAQGGFQGFTPNTPNA